MRRILPRLFRTDPRGAAPVPVLHDLHARGTARDLHARGIARDPHARGGVRASDIWEGRQQSGARTFGHRAHDLARAAAAVSVFVVGVLAAVGSATARDHYIAPTGATTAGEGSATAPWPSVVAALESGTVQPGDRLLLRPGTHGNLHIHNARFEPPLEIAAEVPGAVHVEAIYIARSRGLRLVDLQVWPLAPPASQYNLVTTNHDAADIVFERLDVRASPTAHTDYVTWTHADWAETWRLNGVRLNGARNVIRDSRIAGVNFGITATGAAALVSGNTVMGFSGDGLRGLGQDSVFRGNRVQDCVKIDGNHDDGFQSWATQSGPDGVPAVSGGVLEGNTILEWTHSGDHPLRCRLQGIGMFDGMYRDWTIANNVVAVSVWHGISVYGADNVRILNNTVTHIDGLTEGRPWIMVSDHKDGRAAREVVVANNVAMAYKDSVGGAAVIPRRLNAVVRYPYRMFADPGAYDFRPGEESPLIDAADPRFAPETDVEGRARPLGPAPDLGAYERR